MLKALVVVLAIVLCSAKTHHKLVETESEEPKEMDNNKLVETESEEPKEIDHKLFPESSLVETESGKTCTITGDPHVNNMKGQRFNFNKAGRWQTAFRRGRLQILTQEVNHNYWVYKVKIINGGSSVVYRTNYRRGQSQYGLKALFGYQGSPPHLTRKTLRFGDVSVLLEAKKIWSSIPTSLNLKITYSGSASNLGGYCVWTAQQRRAYRVSSQTWERTESMQRSWPCSFPRAVKKCGGKTNWGCIQDFLRVGRNCVTQANDCNWKHHKKQQQKHTAKAAVGKRHLARIQRAVNREKAKVNKHNLAIRKLKQVQGLVNDGCVGNTITQLKSNIKTFRKSITTIKAGKARHKRSIFHHTSKATCHARYAKVMPKARKSAKKIKLVGGNGRTSGNVYIRASGGSSKPLGWYAVCDDHWDNTDATVVCKQLGFQRGTATMTSRFGTIRQNKFILDDVKCRGSEKDILKCPARRHFTHDCGGGEGAGVRCH